MAAICQNNSRTAQNLSRRVTFSNAQIVHMMSYYLYIKIDSVRENKNNQKLHVQLDSH